MQEDITFNRDPLSENLIRNRFRAYGSPEEVLRTVEVYTTEKGLTIIIAREYCGGRPTDPLRWHISVSGPGRVPTWTELVRCAHVLRPGVPFVLSVPPQHLWMNVNPDVLHLWETNDAALQEEWKANATGDVPYE
jgi:hypothetical protein